jgi:hypothetical protein
MPTEYWDGPTAFAAQLMRFAETVQAPHMSQIITAVRRPVRVAVCGRSGVGRRTVERALRRRGVHVVAEPSAELRLLVIAEVLKGEDRAVLEASELPTVTLLTKADVGGSIGCDAVVPMSGLLATVTALDGESEAALRRFAEEPPDLSSVDAFLDAAHPVDRAVRARLLERLDRFGIVTAVRAFAAGAEPADVVELLQQLSNVDAVLARLRAVAAPVRYRRVQHALGELRTMAARTDDQRVWQFLAADATLAALTVTAVDVLESAGWVVGYDDPVLWSRYAWGPLTALHRACAADVLRGALR